MSGRWSRTGLLVLVLASGGCYRTVPLREATPAPGTLVRVDLTREGTLRLSELIGPGVVSVDGEAQEVGADSWELLLTGTRLENGNEVEWRRERVALPAAYVASVAERRLDRGATALTAAAITAGAFLITRLFQGGAGGEGDGPGDVPPG